VNSDMPNAIMFLEYGAKLQKIQTYVTGLHLFISSSSTEFFLVKNVCIKNIKISLEFFV